MVLEFQQQGQDSRQGAQGRASGVIIQDEKARGQDGKARGRAGVAVQDTTTRTTRSEGVFTIVQDGGTASTLVANEAPSTVVSLLRDYGPWQGYAVQGRPAARGHHSCREPDRPSERADPRPSHAAGELFLSPG